MVQNTGSVLENRQNGKCEKLEIVAFYLLYNLFFRYNGVEIEVDLYNKR